MGFFNDPLTRRELSGVARRWQTFVARIIVGLIMGWAVYYLWERAAWARDYSTLAGLSREVFAAYFGGLMVFLPLLAVSAAGDLVTKEVRNGTLGLLFLTPLTPWKIAAGKWKAAMAQVVMILFAGGPVAAICVYLGGIGGFEILWGAALPLATAGFAAAVSLFFSTVFRGPAMTVITSILVLVAGTLAPPWFLNDFDGLEMLAYVQPVFAALVSAEPRIARGSPELALYAWCSASVVALLGAAALVGLAAWRLPLRLHALPGPSLAARSMAGLDRFFERINVGRVRFFARSGEVWQDRALLWKELRLRATGKLRHATRVSMGLLVLSILPFLGSEYALRDWTIFFLWVFSGLLVLQAVVVGVSLFAHEREGRQWDVLLSTPLNTYEILHAKIVGGLAALAPTAVAYLIYVVMIACVHSHGASLGFIALLPTAVFVVFALLVSAAASLRARTYRGAFGLAMAVVLGVLVGIPTAGAALDELRVGRFREEDVMAPTNPGWYLVQASDALHSYYGAGNPRFDGDYLAAYLFIYFVLSSGILLWMRASFNRVAGRV